MFILEIIQNNEDQFESKDVKNNIIAYEELVINSKVEDDMVPEPSTSFTETKPKPENLTAGLFCAAIGCRSNKFDDPDIQLFKFPAQKKR